MKSVPTEIVFSQFSDPQDEVDHQAGLFCYGNGPVKVPGPWKRGRPKGALNKKAAKATKTKTTPPLEINFQFIHTSPQSKAIDPSSRAIIRKHVKQRTRHHDSHQKENATSKYADNKSILENHSQQTKSSEILGIERDCSRTLSKCNLYQIPGVDPFNKSCIKLEPYMHDLLHYFSTNIWRTLYTLEHLANINPVHVFWLPLAFQDPALIHSLIGCADIYVSGYRIIRQEGRGLRHLQASIAIVNIRLKKMGKGMKAKTVADGDEWGGSIEDIEGEEWLECGDKKTYCRLQIIIVLVAAIALLEYGQGRTQNWRIHMLGLKHLITLAGGLHTLLPRPQILEKIYRADLYGSLDCSETPFFTYQFPPSMPSIQHPTPSTNFQNSNFKTPRFHNIAPMLKEGIQNFESTLFFWAQATKTRKEAEFVRGVLTRTQYLLLSEKFPFEPANEFLRMTLIIFLLSILNERPRDCSIGRKICGIFRERFEEVVLDGEGEDGDFLLWAVFLAVCVMRWTECEDLEWLVGTLRGLCLRELVGGMGELKERLGGFLWVECIHFEGLEWVWGEMERCV